MYVAQQHTMGDAAALEFARGVGVGQLVSTGPNGLNATFVPFNIEVQGERTFVQFHLNRVNPQWRDDGEAMLIVQGPSAHISGLDFPAEAPGQKLPTVPTLNYVTVHLRGALSVHDDDAWKQSHLTRLVEHFESEWRVGVHTSFELVRAAFVAIVGVELEVTEVIGKAKLGQNLSSEAIAHTAGNLRERDESACPVADLMEQIAVPWALSREERVGHARRDVLPIAWNATPQVADSRRYALDFDWLWTNPPHNDGSPAILRLILTDGQTTTARVAADAWLATLTEFEDGQRGRGGWAVYDVVGMGSDDGAGADSAGAEGECGQVVLDLISGGEDVLDGIDSAATEAYENLIAGTDLGVEWVQLPR
ncbi:FMN-binding negative transcriptional regulator [Trueperella pecoris]|uniref:FMN-binding negative transcriptional regulator n=1 Tax=Trueperella pecoris TaxID=2733571 RepID=A0A7M1R1K7_9ACTO|nr:FMN-binding negative transcriptional regulator [Trueperella pecoris]QOR47564.1 FMN-binding negative transcriptional regulator [Trueperella pecoris]